MAEAEAAYRRALAAERVEAGRAADSVLEEILRLARQALREAYERSKRLRLLWPFPLLPRLRERVGRWRCQAASLHAACVTASGETIGGLLAAATVAVGVAGAPMALGASPLGLGPGPEVVRVAAARVAQIAPPPPEVTGQAFATAGPDGFEASLSGPMLPGVARRPTDGTQATVERRREIILGRNRISVWIGDREFMILEGETRFSFPCDPRSITATMVCWIHDQTPEETPMEE